MEKEFNLPPISPDDPDHVVRERCLMLSVRCIGAIEGSCLSDVILLADAFREYIEKGMSIPTFSSEEMAETQKG